MSSEYQMAARLESLFTVEDIELMPDDGNRYEVIEGELYVSRAPGIPHQRVTKNVIIIFGNYLEQHPIGEMLPTLGLVFDKYNAVIPDLVFYTHERAKQIIDEERLVAAPELAIEILSHGYQNVTRDRVAKRNLYGKRGVTEYWIVDAYERAVETYRLNNDTLDLVATLRDDDEVSTPLLPGLKFKASELFR
jgi:Uma2 family endonuclease